MTRSAFSRKDAQFRKILVEARRDAPNELVIETDRTVVPAALHAGSDRRGLGLQLNSLGWMPAR